MTIPTKYTKEVPNLWSITRSNGKSTLVQGTSAEAALARYNSVASLEPGLGFPQETIEAVKSVAYIAKETTTTEQRT